MYLYVYEGFTGGPDRQMHTEALVIRALESFAEETGTDIMDISREICRTEKGKPYFKDIPVSFSVSHTDDLWVCLMTNEYSAVGVDIQQIREAREKRIADIYFTEDERRYLEQNGTEGFFRIWARKEAYAKYTGEGINKKLSAVSTLNSGDLYYIDFDLRADVKGACCAGQKGELCIRMI